jgi:acetoin utilization protein AcuB
VQERLVGEWMTRHVHHVRPEDPVFTALEVMAERVVRHVLVLGAGGQLVGIVSNRDVVRAALHDPERRLDLHGVPVAEVMTRAPLETTWPGATLRAVADQMRARRVSALPVLEGDQLLGIITTDDLLAALAAPDAPAPRRPDL